MDTPSDVALPFLLAALPICVWASYVDLSRMKIPNRSVVALAGVFVVLGLALVALTDWTLGGWAWRLVNLAVVLLAGMLLNAVSLMGAGDAKFAAAAAPFVAVSDIGPVLTIFFLSLLGCWILHRIAKHSVGRRLAPDWESWSSGKRFPMGVALATTLVAYLAVSAAL